MKNKKVRIIVIIAAVLVVVAGAVTAIVGFNAGWFAENDELVKKEVFDESGKFVVRDEYYNSKDELEYKVIKGYSDVEKTKILRETYMSADDKIQKIVNYNKSGVVSSVDEYNGPTLSVHHEYVDGKATGAFTKYEYNENGDLILSTEYDAKKEVAKKIKREYNADGKIVLYLETGKEGNQISKTVYQYNDNGKETKVTFYDGENITGHIEYDYDNQGRRTKMSEYVKGVLDNYRTYTYDENGVVTETKHKADE